MNKFSQNLLLILLVFYPFCAWISYFGTDKGITMVYNIFLIPYALYLLFEGKRKIPTYLIFFLLFTMYHIGSTILYNLVPRDMNFLYFILADTKLLACMFMLIIEYTDFDAAYIKKFSAAIFVVVGLAFVVSLIQTKDPMIFYNTHILVEGIDLSFLEEQRIYSIFSWISANTVGISFPILCGILIERYGDKKLWLFVIFLCAVAVSFLTKSRYAMVSTIIVFFQLLFSRRSFFMNLLSMVFLGAIGIFVLLNVAKSYGYNIDEVIANRILEKDGDMVSAKARILSYEVFMEKFPENPWLGVGPETREDVKQLLGEGIPLIHVGYLSYLYFYGFIGCFFFFTAIYYLFRKSWIVGRAYNKWAVFFGLISFCVANATLVFFEVGDMGILISILYLRYYQVFYPQELEEEEAGQHDAEEAGVGFA